MSLDAHDARLADHGRLVARLGRHDEAALVLEHVVALVPRADVGVPVVPRLGDGVELEAARHPRLVHQEPPLRRAPLRLLERRLLRRGQFLIHQSRNMIKIKDEQSIGNNLVLLKNGVRHSVPHLLRLEIQLVVVAHRPALEPRGSHVRRRVPQRLHLAGALVFDRYAVVPVTRYRGQRLLAEPDLAGNVIHKVRPTDQRLSMNENAITVHYKTECSLEVTLSLNSRSALYPVFSHLRYT